MESITGFVIVYISDLLISVIGDLHRRSTTGSLETDEAGEKIDLVLLRVTVERLSAEHPNTCQTTIALQLPCSESSLLWRSVIRYCLFYSSPSPTTPATSGEAATMMMFSTRLRLATLLAPAGWLDIIPDHVAENKDLQNSR